MENPKRLILRRKQDDGDLKTWKRTNSGFSVLPFLDWIGILDLWEVNDLWATGNNWSLQDGHFLW